MLNGSELGTAQHAEKDAAMEKASLITLHLLDPDGKSIVANIHHPNEVRMLDRPIVLGFPRLASAG